MLVEAVRPMTAKSSWKFLLEGDYEFAYLDGLNRYYVAHAHRSLMRFFAVPVSACDPFVIAESHECRLSLRIWSVARRSRQAK